MLLLKHKEKECSEPEGTETAPMDTIEDISGFPTPEKDMWANPERYMKM